MERSGATEAEAKSEIVNDCLSECLSKVQIDDETLDVDVLLTEINNVYQTIIQAKAPNSSYENFVTASFADRKSNETAEEMRDVANGLLREGKLNEAFLCAYRRVLFAETGSKELALAYADRSYILFRLRRYESCIEDINRATELANCPANLKKKLRERKKQCLMQREKKQKNKEEDDRLEWRKLCNFEPLPNVILPNSSPKLKIECDDEEREMNLIASEDIQPGEILLIEDIHVVQIDRMDHGFMKCNFCLITSDCMIPCTTCTLELYCSDKCRNEAYKSYHKSECKMIWFHARGTNNDRATLALRLFLIGTEQGKQLTNLMKELKPCDIFAEKFDSSVLKSPLNYRSILGFGRTDNFMPELTENVFYAVQIMIVLLRTGFFGDYNTLPDRLGPVELFSALLLTNHLFSLGRWSFTILNISPEVFFSSVLQDGSIAEENLCIAHAGFAVYPSVPLIKHSCYANTNAFFQNRQRISFATRRIRSGEKLSYSPYHVFPYMIAGERAAKLSLNHLVCNCHACLHEWPLLQTLKTQGIVFSVHNFETKVKEILMHTNVLLEAKSIEQLSNMDLLHITIAHIKVLEEILTKPSFDIFACEMLLTLFMKIFYCDFYERYPMRSARDYHFKMIMKLITRRVYERYPTSLFAEN